MSSDLWQILCYLRLLAICSVLLVTGSNGAEVQLACARCGPTSDLSVLKASIAAGLLTETSMLIDRQTPTETFPFYCFDVLKKASTSSDSSCALDLSATKKLVKSGHVKLLSNGTTTGSSVKVMWAGTLTASSVQDSTSNKDTVLGTQLNALGFSLVLGLAFVGIVMLFFIIRCCVQRRRSKLRASKYFTQPDSAPKPGEGATTVAISWDIDDGAAMDFSSLVLKPIGGPQERIDGDLRTILSALGVDPLVAERLRDEYNLLTIDSLRQRTPEEQQRILVEVDCSPMERQRIAAVVLPLHVGSGPASLY